MAKKKKRKYDFQGIGLSGNDKRRARKKFDNYRQSMHVENVSDLQLLEELVFRETYQDRWKQKVADIQKLNDKNPEAKDIIPYKTLEELDKNLTQIFNLKEKLGFFEDKKKDDPFKWINILKKKFEVWRQENQASRKLTCPFCGEIFFLMIRTDKYEAKKFPFFRDKILANKYLWKCYKEEKITKTDISKILGTSTDYIDFLEREIFNKEK